MMPVSYFMATMGLLGTELARQRRETRQIGEQDSDLPAFARLRGDGRFPVRGFGLVRRELSDGGQQLLAMAKGAHPELLEVLCGQIAQRFAVDVVLAKRIGVLPEGKIVEPSLYIHVGWSPRMFVFDRRPHSITTAGRPALILYRDAGPSDTST